MDVRAKQRLCYQQVFLLLAGLAAVSPHVISIVSRFLVFSNRALIEIENQYATAIS